MTEKIVPSWENGSNLDYFVNKVIRSGLSVDSRYGPCLESLGGRFVCESGSLIIRDGINYALGWMELYQLIAGVYDPEQIQRVAPKANQSLFTYDMAYGPRVSDKIPSILTALSRDRNSRQAVVFVGKPEDGPTSSLPCTISIQFLIRNNIINCVVSMRSWDLCRGLPYDLMMFSGLLEIVGRCLNIATGDVMVQSGSNHVYLDQLDKLPRLRNQKWEFNEHVPDVWGDAVDWFKAGMENIQQGQVPFGIVLTDR